ncbi:MAG TPA: response regulator, partial [Candidatus Angelobacter sp.]
TPLETDGSVYAFLNSRSQPRINLVLMCHSVPEASRIELCRAFKTRHPYTPILMLYNGYDPTVAQVDGRLENMADPQALLDTVQLLLSAARRS